MEKIFKKYPELFEITKVKENKASIIYGKKFEKEFIESLSWIYTNYFNENVLVFLPKQYVFESEYDLNCTLESIEQNSYTKNTVVIFAYSDIFFNTMCKINKRRFNTQLKNISKKCKCILLSITNLKIFNLNALETFELNKLNNYKLHYSLIDLIDPDEQIFIENVSFMVQCIKEKGDKRIYISLNMNIDKILFIESELKKHCFLVSRKEDKNCQIIINSSRTTENTILNDTYDIYILIIPLISEYSDFVHYIKDIPEDVEIYMDSTKEKNILHCLNALDQETMKKTITIDSIEFTTYSECISELKDPVLATDEYYVFEPSEQIRDMDLSNLSKTEYDTIRNFVKFKLNSEYDLEIKTCQLSTPSSPKDRSRKLNSLSNKISSADYRCEVTCEIFKDYTIGVILWNEVFSQKLLELMNSEYVYQTTSGNWKYTKVTL